MKRQPGGQGAWCQPLGHSRSWENRSSFCPTSKALAVSYRAGAVVGHVMEKGTGWDLGFWREDGRNAGKTKKEDAERGKSMGATGRRPDGEKTIHMLRGSFGRLQYRKLPSNGPQAALMLYC